MIICVVSFSLGGFFGVKFFLILCFWPYFFEIEFLSFVKNTVKNCFPFD